MRVGTSSSWISLLRHHVVQNGVTEKSGSHALIFHLKFFHILVKVQFMMEALSETEASQV